MGQVRRPTYTTTDPATGEKVKRVSKVWWIRYYRNGRRHEESSGSTRKTEAQRLLALREGACARGEPITAQVGRLRFEEAAADVLADYRANGRRTAGQVEQRLRDHLLPVFGARRMASITTADLRAYTTARQEAGASNGTINRELAIVRRAFRLAQQSGTAVTRPHVPMLREADPRSGFFERADFEDVRDALPDYLRGVVTFAFYTGWRVPSEILPLTWDRVNRADKTVTLDPGTTKNREPRLLPFANLPELEDVIEDAWSEHQRLARQGTLCPYVFTRAGKRIKSFRKSWDAACAAAGVRGRIPHDFRRTAVRNLVRAGVPDTVAMKVTGHKTRSVFDRYNIVSEADLRDALGALSGKEKGKKAKAGRVAAFPSA